MKNIYLPVAIVSAAAGIGYMVIGPQEPDVRRPPDDKISVVHGKVAARDTRSETRQSLLFQGSPTASQRDLTVAFQRSFPTLRNVDLKCRDGECLLNVSSKGLTDPAERNDIYQLVASEPQNILAGTRFTVRDRQISVFSDDTTTVKLRVTVPS
jgi:hypothetical protein